MDFDKAMRDGVEEIPVFDCFVVDIERFTHVAETESRGNSSRISRNHSRKGLNRGGGGQKKINTTAATEETAAAEEASTTATIHDGSTPEKPLVIVLGTADRVVSPKIHHQITINKGILNRPPAEGGKRSVLRYSRAAWSIDPRKILMFFATLSSIGTVLLIYFTLSMSKLNGDDDGLN